MSAITVVVSGEYVRGVIVKQSHSTEEIGFSADVTETRAILGATTAEELRMFAYELLNTADKVDDANRRRRSER